MQTNLVRNCSVRNLLWNAFWVYYFLKHVDHIIELSMDVSDNNHWLLHLQ